MVKIVFLLSLANLGLGFGLAIALDRLAGGSWKISGLGLPRRRRRQAFEIARRPPEPAAAQSARLLAALADRLDGLGIPSGSLLEGVLWLTKLETAALRHRLLKAGDSSPVELASNLQGELKSWRELIKHGSELVHQAEDASGPQTRDFLELLEDQEFRASVCQVAMADGEPAKKCHELLVDAATTMRDRADAILADWLRAQGTLSTVPESFLRDPETGVLSRLGLEAVIESWRQDDLAGSRLASVILIDLDRFERLSRRLGTATGDILLHRFGELLAGLVRKGRGFDRVAQVAGPRFLLFLGDTSVTNAAKAAERIRQTAEATSFKTAAQTLQATVCCAVTEIDPKESVPELISRLEKILTEAKRAGRNRSALDQGGGPQLIELLAYPVVARTIEL